MLFFSWNKSREERKGKKETKTRKQNKAKKKDRKERKKGQEEERDRERKIEKGGGQKKLRRNKGRHSKINKECPFLGGKQGFFVLQSKERKGTTTNQKKQKINKFGGFRAKWGGPLGHLTWSLNPPKQKQNKKKTNKKKQQKRNKEGLGPSEVALRAASPDP